MQWPSFTVAGLQGSQNVDHFAFAKFCSYPQNSMPLKHAGVFDLIVIWSYLAIAQERHADFFQTWSAYSYHYCEQFNNKEMCMVKILACAGGPMLNSWAENSETALYRLVSITLKFVSYWAGCKRSLSSRKWFLIHLSSMWIAVIRRVRPAGQLAWQKH